MQKVRKAQKLQIVGKGPNGSKWVTWLQMATNGSNWIQMDPNGPKGLQLALNGYKWIQMALNASTSL